MRRAGGGAAGRPGLAGRLACCLAAWLAALLAAASGAMLRCHWGPCRCVLPPASRVCSAALPPHVRPCLSPPTSLPSTSLPACHPPSPCLQGTWASTRPSTPWTSLTWCVGACGAWGLQSRLPARRLLPACLPSTPPRTRTLQHLAAPPAHTLGRTLWCQQGPAPPHPPPPPPPHTHTHTTHMRLRQYPTPPPPPPLPQFMDAINRRLALEFLLQFAWRNPERQVLLLTPQDVSGGWRGAVRGRLAGWLGAGPGLQGWDDGGHPVGAPCVLSSAWRQWQHSCDARSHRVVFGASPLDRSPADFRVLACRNAACSAGGGQGARGEAAEPQPAAQLHQNPAYARAARPPAAAGAGGIERTAHAAQQPAAAGECARRLPAAVPDTAVLSCALSLQHGCCMWHP